MIPPPAPKRTPSDADEAIANAEAISRLLAGTIERAGTFSAAELDQGVNGEWSTVQSLRHMTFVIDVWLGKTILGEVDPFHPIGLPPHFIGATLPGSSIDPAAAPTFADACEALDGRLESLRNYSSKLTDDELARAIGTHAETVAGGLGVIFDELTFHDAFVNRDLDAIAARR